jgi:O-antigen/teichoic acid export membrane protein
MATLSRRATFVGALWSLSSVAFPLVSTLLLSIAIARRLGPEELGEQSVIAYVGSSVAGVVVFAATQCAIQLVAVGHGRGDSDQAGLETLSRRVHAAAGVVAGAGIAGLGMVRAHPAAWVVMGLVTCVDAIGWAHGARLIGRHGWRAVSPLRLVSQIAAALLGVLAVFLGGGLVGVFAAQLLTSAWLTLTLRRRDRREDHGTGVSTAAASLRPFGRLWLLFILSMGLSQVVDKRMELLFLDAFGSAHQVAVYAVAFTLVAVAVTVPTSLAGAAVPGIAAAGAADPGGSLTTHLRRAARLASVAACLLTAGLAVLGPRVVLLLWGPGLRDAAAVVPWMALSVLFIPIRVLYDAYWTGVGRLPVALGAVGAGAVADVVAAAVLVPRFEIAGAVAANVTAQVVTCGLLAGYTRRQAPGVGTPVPLLARLAVPALVAGAAGWLASAACAGVAPWVALLAGGLAFLASVVAIGLGVGLVPADDAEWLAGTLPAAIGPLLAVAGGWRWYRSAQAGGRPTARTPS